jgi:hypothetical protein
MITSGSVNVRGAGERIVRFFCSSEWAGLWPLGVRGETVTVAISLARAWLTGSAGTERHVPALGLHVAIAQKTRCFCRHHVDTLTAGAMERRDRGGKVATFSLPFNASRFQDMPGRCFRKGILEVWQTLPIQEKVRAER